VLTATGFAQLTSGTTSGETYVMDLGTLPASPTYAQIDAVYLAGAKVALSGTSPTIGAAAFALVGVDLTSAKKRTVIVAHEVSGVRSYELLVVTFNAS